MMQFSCVVEGAFGSVGSLPNHLNLPFAAANWTSIQDYVGKTFSTTKPPMSWQCVQMENIRTEL
jgi:hypothetical protein